MSLTSVAQQLAVAGCVRPEDEARILLEEAATPGQLDAMVAQRVAGVPLEHIVGWAEFCGRRFIVEPGVFVPRPRSAHLVAEASSLARCIAGSGRGVVVVDLCCGVGAIGASIAAEVAGVDLHAADIDARAVACARRNLAPWGGTVHHGNLFAPLPRRLRHRVDVLVASPPYVPTDEIQLLAAEAREFEPTTALDGGAEGLDVVVRIARDARHWLSADGCLVVEVGTREAERAAHVLEELGYRARCTRSAADDAAAVVGRRTDPAAGTEKAASLSETAFGEG